MWQERLAQLVTTCHWIGAKGWAPATGGNMSVRQDETWCWLSESGRDKGSLTTEDFLQVEIASNKAPSGRKPSAETGLHTLVYRLFPEANFVLHVHTVNATVLSRIEKSDTLALQGYEMQKTLTVSIATLIPYRWRFSITTRISTPWRRALKTMRRPTRCVTASCCAATA